MRCCKCNTREADFLDGLCTPCRVETVPSARAMTAEDRARATPTRITVDGETGPHVAATVQQPAPVHNDQHSAHDLVVADMRARKAFGLAKYKTILQARNGRDPLVDAYQEQLDLLAYMRLEIEERGLWMYQLADEIQAGLARFVDRVAAHASLDQMAAYKAGRQDAVSHILELAGKLCRASLPGCTRGLSCPFCTSACCDQCGRGCWDRSIEMCSHDILDRHSPRPVEAAIEPMRVWRVDDTEKHWIAARSAGEAIDTYAETYDFSPEDTESFSVALVTKDEELDREMDDGEGGKGSLRTFLAAAKGPELLASSVV